MLTMTNVLDCVNPQIKNRNDSLPWFGPPAGSVDVFTGGFSEQFLLVPKLS